MRELRLTLCSRRLLFSAWASLSRRSISSSLAMFDVLALRRTSEKKNLLFCCTVMGKNKHKHNKSHVARPEIHQKCHRLEQLPS